MAGNKKGKKSKKQQQKKREKTNPHKSNSKVDVGWKEGDTVDHVFGNNVDNEKEIERLIYKMIENAYKKVCSMLLALNYNYKTVQMAILGGGHISGDGNIASNLLENSIAYLNSCPMVDGEYVFDDKVPIFDNMIDLITFWVEELVNFAVQMYPDDSKCDALRHILSCKSLDVESVCRDYNLPSGEGSSSNIDGSVSSDEKDFDVLLKENILEFKGICLTCSPSVSSNLEKKNDINSTCVESNQSLKDLEYFYEINLNHFESLPKVLDEEINFEELLRNSSAEKKDGMISELENLVISLEKQIMECKEWAERKEGEVLEKEKQEILELNMLRQEKLESEEIKKKRVELVTTRIAEMLKKELDGGKERDQLADLDGKMKNLEVANAEIRADVNAVKINEEEIKKNLERAVKKEKEEFKRIEKFEKQIRKFQGHIHGENEMSLQLNQQLHLVDEAQKETMLKLKHEQEERQKANNILLEERRLTRIAKENASKRLASLKQSLEMEQKLAMDHKMRLMGELSELMMPHLLSNKNDDSLASSSSSSHENVLEEGESSKDNTSHEQEIIPIHRRCIFCLQREVCVLFMPCAHLVVCYGCSAYVGKKCPCCQVEIAKKIRVYGGNS